MVDLARLTVRLEAENQKLTRALNKSQRDLRRFEGQAKKSFSAFKAAAVGAFAGLATAAFVRSLSRAVGGILDANDKIAKMAQTTGIGVEELNSYALAANLAGTSLDAFAKGAGRLQRNMFDANRGLKESVDAFEAVGIEVLDSQGNFRDTEDVMLEVADAFAVMADGAEKAAIAQLLFGRGGAQLIPLLNQGSEAIKKYKDEQRELGNVLTREVAAASERVNDNFTRLGAVAQGSGRQLTEGLLEPLETITDLMVDLGKEGNETSRVFGQTFGVVLKGTAVALLFIKNSLDVVLDTVGSTAAALAAIAQGEFTRAFSILSEGGKDIVSEFGDVSDAIGKLFLDIETDIADSVLFKDQGAGGASDNIKDISEDISVASSKIEQDLSVMGRALDLIDAQFDELDRQEATEFAGLTPLVTEEIEEMAVATEEAFSEMSVFADQAARNMQSGFADYLFDPFQEDGLNGMLRGFVDTLRRMAAEAASASIFEDLLSFVAGAAGGSGFLANLAGVFSGPRQLASGGFIGSNEPAIVGENGPELFIPKTQGQVVPNSQLAGAAGMTVNVNVSGGDLAGAGQSATQIGFDIGRAISLASRRNG